MDSRVILTYEINLRLNEGIYVVKQDCEDELRNDACSARAVVDDALMWLLLSQLAGPQLLVENCKASDP